MAFTSIHLDHNEAKVSLEKAYEVAQEHGKSASKYHEQIRQVITGNHLTYRYILITNLLAKATNAEVNALALQAGADFDGAFDSRSLCHKIIVPFERDFLGGRLGRSNEPYLNKPARHKALYEDNAVRKGNDRTLLDACITVLSQCNQEEAWDGLVDAIHLTLNRPSIDDHLVKTNIGTSSHEKLQKFADLLLTSSYEGETCALLAGLAFHYMAFAFSMPFDIRVHPVNQSGASSKEILDIDVYIRNELRFTAEIKDKTYTKEDVDHAANKVHRAGHDAMFFVTGPSAKTTLTEDQIRDIGEFNSVKISVVSISAFYFVTLGFCSENIAPSKAWQVIAKVCHDARLKQITIEAVKQAAKDVGFLDSD